MNNQEIFELMDHFDASAATSLKLTQGDFSLELEKRPAAQAPAQMPEQTAVPAAREAAAEEAADTGLYIEAPLVGTFYAAPSPGADPFVRPRRPGRAGTDRVPAGSHEDDERGQGPLRLRDRGGAAPGWGAGVVWGSADPLSGRLRRCSSGF